MKNWIHKLGTSGQEVKRIQEKLSIQIDGDFGPMTEQAVKDFQSAQGLLVDGAVGPETRRELEIDIHAGIDVSKWNGDVDWLKAKNSGLADYCWVKATEGNNYLCPMYGKHLQAASGSGVLLGAYHFARPDLHDDPLQEVKNFVRNIHIKKGGLRPVLDFEKAGEHSPDSIRNWVLTFLKEFEDQSGVRPIIYTGGNMVKYYLKKDTTGIDDYTLWHAYYPRGKNLDNGIKKDRLGGWKEWRVWQWTGSGSVPGLTGNVDRNWLTGGRSGLTEIIVP